MWHFSNRPGLLECAVFILCFHRITITEAKKIAGAKPALVLYWDKTMKKIILSTVAVFSLAGVAFAEAPVAPAPVLSGEASVDFTRDANDKWGGKTTLELGIDVSGSATVDLDLSAVDGGDVKLDNYTLGTTVAGVGVAFGDDNGMMPGAEKSAHSTMAAPAMTESLKVTLGDASVAVGFATFGSDVSDLSNIQGSYALNDSMTVSGDLNLDSDNWVLGVEADSLVDLGGATLGGAATWDNNAEMFGFEGKTTVAGVTAYANGDQEDPLQNIGGEYTYMLGGAELTAGTNYNLDNETWTPTAGVSFNF